MTATPRRSILHAAKPSSMPYNAKVWFFKKQQNMNPLENHQVMHQGRWTERPRQTKRQKAMPWESNKTIPKPPISEQQNSKKKAVLTTSDQKTIIPFLLRQ
jgi:hypothetical protein